jgi:Na+/phosphate symporter
MSARSPETALFISRLDDAPSSNFAARLGKITIAVTIVVFVVVAIVEALSRGSSKDNDDDSSKLLLKTLLKISSAAVWSARNETLNLTMSTLRPN